MAFKSWGLAAAAVLAGAATAMPAQAQDEQFLPALVYRTGPYAPNGIPFANGVADYWNRQRRRDHQSSQAGNSRACRSCARHCCAWETGPRGTAQW